MTYYCVKFYHVGMHSHLIYSDNFAGRVKGSLGPNPLVCFSADFFLFTEAILFDFQRNSPSVFTLWHATLHLTLGNAPSGSASHLATGKVSKTKGAIERLFGIFLGFHEHFTQWSFKMAGEKVCDDSIK